VATHGRWCSQGLGFHSRMEGVRSRPLTHVGSLSSVNLYMTEFSVVVFSSSGIKDRVALKVQPHKEPVLK
jgi:hypothetical protein